MAVRAGCSLDWFSDRLLAHFSGQQEMQQIEDSSSIHDVLSTVLAIPLHFSEDGTMLSDPLYWFQGAATGHILDAERVDDTWLLKAGESVEELVIDTMTVHLDKFGTDLNFIHLLCAPVTPIAQPNYEREEVVYLVEQGAYLSLREFETQNPPGKVEFRTRYLTPHHVFIAPKESRLNHARDEPGQLIHTWYEKLSAGEMTLATFAAQLTTLPVSPLHLHLMGN